MTKNHSSILQKLGLAIASVTVLSLNVTINPSLAADPFRGGGGRNIGTNTESAFKAVFEKGNYPEAQKYIDLAKKTEPNEPLIYALQGCLSYLESDFTSLKTYADQTLTTSQKLSQKDQLRGNLYTAVGYFLKGAYEYQQEGAIGALKNLQEVFKYLEVAKKIDSQDPELNLINGYMELMIAVKMPFSDVNQAIKQLETYGKPNYLAMRGIAIGYRDLKKYSESEKYTDQLISMFPNNPELRHLKAQVLVKQNKRQEAHKQYKMILAKRQQLPKAIVAQIVHEFCANRANLQNKSVDCTALYNQVKAAAGTWGPNSLPLTIDD
jgi:tetratricopeptide (TPR) repeat protein